jgi:hypothetical protein
VTDFWTSPLGQTIDKAQDADVAVWVYGLNAEGTHALVVGPANITVASILATNGSLGRFHCRRETWDECEDTKALAAQRFPTRV